MTDHVSIPPPSVKPLYKLTQIVWYILYFIEVILAFRFLLKLFGANAAAGFTNFIYSISSIFASPFFNVIRSPEANGSVIEWSTLLAMLVYWVIAWGIVKLILIGKPVSRMEAEEKMEMQDSE